MPVRPAFFETTFRSKIQISMLTASWLRRCQGADLSAADHGASGGCHV